MSPLRKFLSSKVAIIVLLHLLRSPPAQMVVAGSFVSPPPPPPTLEASGLVASGDTNLPGRQDLGAEPAVGRGRQALSGAPGEQLEATRVALTEGHKQLHQRRSHRRVKPPRAYCARVSRAVGPHSACFKHLVADLPQGHQTLIGHQQQGGAISNAVWEREQHKHLHLNPFEHQHEHEHQREPHDNSNGSVGWKKMAMISSLANHKRDELVYVRLETVGTKITDLSTQAINERLLRRLLQLLLATSDGDADEQPAAQPAQVPPPDAHHLQGGNATTRRQQRGAGEATLVEGADEAEVREIRAQIADSPPGVDGELQAANCRFAIERTLCRLVYPSCHFRLADVSALVRPPCREDCLLLRDLYCPNLNLAKFAKLVRRELNATLMSTLNPLDLLVEGDHDSLIEAQPALEKRTTTTTAAATTTTELETIAPTPAGSGSGFGLESNRNATFSLGPNSNGGNRFGTNEQLDETSSQNKSEAPGDKDSNEHQHPEHEIVQSISSGSLHFYWPHEATFGDCHQMPSLRFGPRLAFASAAKTNIQCFSQLAGGVAKKCHTNGKNKEQMGAQIKHLNETHHDSNASATVAPDNSHWSPEMVWRWRQRNRIKWPICSNAHLTRGSPPASQPLPLASHSSAANRTHSDKATGPIFQPSESSPDCLATQNGLDYFGPKNKTKSGLDCQSWQAQSPHKHRETELQFDNMRDAHNHCRNPGGLKQKPWCYTTNPDVRWEYCNIDTCSRDLLVASH